MTRSYVLYTEDFKKLSIKLFLHILKNSQHISLGITPSRCLINRDSKERKNKYVHVVFEGKFKPFLNWPLSLVILP